MCVCVGGGGGGGCCNSSNSLTHCNECIQWTAIPTTGEELTQISGKVPVPSTINPEEHSISEHSRAACFVYLGSHKGLSRTRRKNIAQEDRHLHSDILPEGVFNVRVP